MKNWSIIIIMLVGFFTGAVAKAQTPQVLWVSDTLNVTHIGPSPGVVQLIYLGKIAASDPDGDELTYEIMPSPERRFFSVNKNQGYLYTRPKYLDELQRLGEIEIEIRVSDGDLIVTKKILLIFNVS